MSSSASSSLSFLEAKLLSPWLSYGLCFYEIHFTMISLVWAVPVDFLHCLRLVSLGERGLRINQCKTECPFLLHLGVTSSNIDHE